MFILINVTGSWRYCLSDMMWNQVNFWFYLALLISCINFSNGTVEVLKNSDFESSHFNGNWYCAGGCSLTLNSDSYEGSHSVKVSHRLVVYLGLVARKPVFGVSVKARLKPACSATETS